MNDQQFQFFSNFIQKEIGIVYGEVNKYQLEGRLESFLSESGFKDLDSLREALEKHSLPRATRIRLIDLATNNETSFFRDKTLFDALEFEVFPDLAQRFSQTVKVWSLACSSGQEAASIGIVLSRLAEKGAVADHAIVCSDISEGILERARNGIYTELEVSRGLDPLLLENYFDNIGQGKFQLKSQLRSKRRFQKTNLLDGTLTDELFPIVFLRNVLIYFEVETRTKILESLTRNIEIGGYLVLGSAENLIGISQNFEPQLIRGAYFYQRLK